MATAGEGRGGEHSPLPVPSNASLTSVKSAPGSKDCLANNRLYALHLSLPYYFQKYKNIFYRKSDSSRDVSSRALGFMNYTFLSSKGTVNRLFIRIYKIRLVGEVRLVPD